MEFVNGVFDLSNEFMKDAKHVTLNNKKIEKLANEMQNTGITPFPPETTGTDEDLLALKELVANSINYCYWYGKPTVRPNGSSSTVMYEIVNEALEHHTQYWPDYIKARLATSRMPLLEERIKHINEVASRGSMFLNALLDSKDKEFYPLFNDLVLLFPGYSSDQFLKRASLLFLALYRRLSWFEDAVQVLPVPADYQVPKMLRHFGCFHYGVELTKMVDGKYLIPKHSQMECEIRAATVVTCKQLQDITGWNISDIDGWLWLRRKEATEPFHLTITTDY